MITLTFFYNYLAISINKNTNIFLWPYLPRELVYTLQMDRQWIHWDKNMWVCDE